MGHFNFTKSNNICFRGRRYVSINHPKPQKCKKKYENKKENVRKNFGDRRKKNKQQRTRGLQSKNSTAE